MATATELLSRFADAADTSSRRAALIDLVKTKQIHKVASEEPFRRGLERLAHSACETAGEIDRLLAVATLQRAAAAAPPIRGRVKSLMTDHVAGPLSDLHRLPDVDDRLYAAKSWRTAPHAWSLDALATAAALEESGEATRKECIEGVVELADDFTEAASALCKALLAVTFRTKKPGDSLGRRSVRVLGALAAAILKSHKPVGDDFGREIGRLVDQGFRSAGRPESQKVRIDLVEQVSVLTHAVVKADFSHAGDYKTYDALSAVSEWFKPHEWQEICIASQAADAVARVRDDVKKSLLLLASAGKTDDQLRHALTTAAGSRENADAIRRSMAKEHPGIPDDVRDWLAGARKRIRSASAVESRERAVDEVIAELLVSMTQLTRASAVVRSDVLPDVSIVLPQSVEALSRLVGMADVMGNTLSLAVTWRSLRLKGTAGQEVEFSPVEHRFVANGARGRRVRLLSPVVERISEDGVPRVVLKAAVEPVPIQHEQVVGAGSLA